MGRSGIHIECWWESQKEKDYQEDLDMDWRIVLKYMLENRIEWYGLVSSGSGCESVEGSYERSSEPSISCWEIL
jgi:hypothetical protein